MPLPPESFAEPRSRLLFEWDSAKYAPSLRKHGIRFEEAATSFADPFAIDIGEIDERSGEQRWAHIGISIHQRLIVAIYVERPPYLRIISAREVTRSERRI